MTTQSDNLTVRDFEWTYTPIAASFGKPECHSLSPSVIGEYCRGVVRKPTGYAVFGRIGLGFSDVYADANDVRRSIGRGGGILLARSIGQGAIERGQALIWHALILALTGASIFSAVYFSLGDVILKALGGQGDVLLQAKSYAVVLFTGCALIWITNILSSVYRGMGNMKYPAVLMVLAVIIQIPLSGSLILGWGPFPSIGIAGAAVSAILSALIATTLLLLPLIFGIPWLSCGYILFSWRSLFSEIS